MTAPFSIFSLRILENLTLGGSAFVAYRSDLALPRADRSVAVWNPVEMSTFFASLVVWPWAQRETQRKDPSEDILFPAWIDNKIDKTLAPRMDERLPLLEDQSTCFWRGGGRLF